MGLENRETINLMSIAKWCNVTPEQFEEYDAVEYEARLLEQLTFVLFHFNYRVAISKLSLVMLSWYFQDAFT